MGSDLEQRLFYLNLGEEDLQHLRTLKPVLEKHADVFVAAFYRQLLSFGPTRALLAEPAVKERLLRKQRAYLVGLADVVFDDAFVEERRRVGEVHERIGLEPRWYLGAFALYYSLLSPLVLEAHRADPERALRTLDAVHKLLMLDSQLALETYIERSEERLEYLTRELSEQSRLLARDFDDQSATLRRTTAEAREAEELASVATLVTGLAHEIGTPMGVIQGHAKLLESALEGEDARWRLQTIQTQVGRISRIIQMLMNMARPRRVRRQPVALVPLIDVTLSFVSEKLSRHRIEVERDLAETPSVLGDGERLQQLLLNLFLNAADAMPDGGRLGVSLAPVGEACVEIRVCDTGTGIPADALERIFEPFFTTKPAGEGNGLGLMVCRGIVTDHGGTIRADSREGEGSEFVVELPTAAVR